MGKSALRDLDWTAGLEAARDWLLPPDPGFLRLRAALRTTLTGLLAWAFVEVAPVELHGDTRAPIVVVVVAIALGIYIAAFLRDTTMAGRAATILCAVPAGAAAVLVGALVAPFQALAALSLVAIIFLTVCANEWGPRWPALAQVVLGGFTFALLSRPAPADLPGWAAALVAATVAGLLTHLVLLPDRPASTLARLETGLRSGMALVLARIDGALLAGGWTMAERGRLLRQLRHLGEIATLAETAGIPPADAIRLFELELVTERAGRRALAQLPAEADERTAPRLLIAAIRARLSNHGSAIIPPAGGSPLDITLANLAALLDKFPEGHAAPHAEPGPAKKHAFSKLGLRHAFQASLASGLAIAGGAFISPNRWYWAAMTAYVLFLGTRSRAESLAKGLQAVAGTLAGVIAGLLLASLLADHPLASILGVFVAVFLAFQASSAAYAVMTFWFVVTLGLMYGLLGYVSDDLLLVRLEETAIGAVCGIATASLFPGAGLAAVAGAASRAVLEALARAVGSAADTLAGGPPDSQQPTLALALHARMTELRSVTQSRLYGLGGAADPALRRRVVGLSFCAEWARELAVAALAGSATPPPERATVLRATSERIVSQAGDLCDLVDPRPASAPARQIVMTPVSARPVVAGLFDAGSEDPSTSHLRLLMEIDSALERMLRRILRHP